MDITLSAPVRSAGRVPWSGGICLIPPQPLLPGLQRLQRGCLPSVCASTWRAVRGDHLKLFHADGHFISIYTKQPVTGRWAAYPSLLPHKPVGSRGAYFKQRGTFSGRSGRTLVWGDWQKQMTSFWVCATEEPEADTEARPCLNEVIRVCGSYLWHQWASQPLFSCV